MYSPKFVNEALRVLGKQLIDDGRLDSVNLYAAGPIAGFLELDTREWQEDDYDQQGHFLDPIKVKARKSCLSRGQVCLEPARIRRSTGGNCLGKLWKIVGLDWTPRQP